MKVNAIAILVFTIITIIIMVAMMIYNAFKGMPTKKKQIQELKTEVEKLQQTINVLNFKLDNPCNKQVDRSWIGVWQLVYVKHNSICYKTLPNAEEYKIKGDYIVDDKGNKYKFDIDNEILIKIEKGGDNDTNKQ